MDKGVGRSLVWVVGIHLNDGAGRILDPQGALAEPVQSDGAFRYDEIFKRMQSYLLMVLGYDSMLTTQSSRRCNAKLFVGRGDDSGLRRALELRHPVVGHAVRPEDTIGSVWISGIIRINVFPNDVLFGCHLEDTPKGSLGDHGVAVQQPLSRADVLAEEGYLFLACDRVLPDFFERDRVDF